MPQPRYILTGDEKSGFFHCVSRVNGRRYAFEAKERERFAELLRAVEKFSGVQVLTWTILSNHFHVVVEIPPRPSKPLSDREFWRRLGAIYTAPEIQDLKQALKMHHAPEELRAKYLARMWDLSEFMKTLKLRYSKWFNLCSDRRGTLWEERFRATRIEGSYTALTMVCAYVDLNAVRAGIADDPVEYRWCGFAEAVGGKRVARAGLRRAWNTDAGRPRGWTAACAEYRRFLYGVGEAREGRRGISPERIRQVWESGGRLSIAGLLQCRLRFISDGLVIGSQSYLEEFLEANRSVLAKGRKGAGSKPTRGDWQGICTFRKPQRKAVRPPEE